MDGGIGFKLPEQVAAGVERVQVVVSAAKVNLVLVNEGCGPYSTIYAELPFEPDLPEYIFLLVQSGVCFVTAELRII